MGGCAIPCNWVMVLYELDLSKWFKVCDTRSLLVYINVQENAIILKSILIIIV